MAYQVKPKIKLCTLWQNTTKDGTKQYFTGYLGGAKIVILHDERAEKPNVWNLYLEEAPPKDKSSQPAAEEPAPRLPSKEPKMSLEGGGKARNFEKELDDEVPF